MDITAHIKAIEALKCALLTDMAALHESMRKPSRQEERDEPLAGMLVSLYKLAQHLGLSYAELDGLAARRLRSEALQGGGRGISAQGLLAHISRGRGEDSCD